MTSLGSYIQRLLISEFIFNVLENSGEEGPVSDSCLLLELHSGPASAGCFVVLRMAYNHQGVAYTLFWLTAWASGRAGQMIAMCPKSRHCTVSNSGNNAHIHKTPCCELSWGPTPLTLRLHGTGSLQLQVFPFEHQQRFLDAFPYILKG